MERRERFQYCLYSAAALPAAVAVCVLQVIFIMLNSSDPSENAVLAVLQNAIGGTFMVQMFLCAAAIPAYLLWMSVRYLRRGVALYVCWLVSPFITALSVVVGYYCMTFVPYLVMGAEGAVIGLFFFRSYTAFGGIVGMAIILIGLTVISILHKWKKAKATSENRNDKRGFRRLPK